MSKRNKLQKFAEVDTLENVYQCYDIKVANLFAANRKPVEMNGRWQEEYFKNNNPITVELACGKGDYTLGLARLFKDRNFIGMDVKGARIWRGATDALAEGLSNVAFLRSRIEKLSAYFSEGEIDEIWITFPDPFLRESQANRRLTASVFLEQYRRVLRKGGVVHLKTDDKTLYDFTLETIALEKGCKLLYNDDDIYAKLLPFDELDIKTFYEKSHLANGRTIKYVRFTFEP